MGSLFGLAARVSARHHAEINTEINEISANLEPVLLDMKIPVRNVLATGASRGGEEPSRPNDLRIFEKRKSRFETHNLATLTKQNKQEEEQRTANMRFCNNGAEGITLNIFNYY